MNEAKSKQTRHFDVELDAAGLYCPLPVLRAKKTLDRMSEDAILKLIATDPGSVKDVEVFTEQAGYKLLHTDHDENFVFYIEKTKSR